MSDQQRRGVGPLAVTIFVLIALACGGYGGMLVQQFGQDSRALAGQRDPDEGLRAELNTARQVIASLRAQQRVTVGQLDEARAALAERDEQFAATPGAQQAEALQELDAARAALAERDEQLASLVEELAAAEAAPAALQQEAARLEAELLQANERLAFLEERNQALAGDLELALSEAARARQLLEMSSAQRAAGALEPPPLANVTAPPPPPPALPKPEPVELRPVLEQLLALAPDSSQSSIEDRLGLDVMLQSPARLELGSGALVTVHRFDAYSGDLLSSELTVRSGGAEELVLHMGAHLNEVMGAPLSGSVDAIPVGGRVRFETARNSATLVLETQDRLRLLVEHVGVAAAPIQVFRLDANPPATPASAPTEGAEGSTVTKTVDDVQADGSEASDALD